MTRAFLDLLDLICRAIECIYFKGIWESWRGIPIISWCLWSSSLQGKM